MMMDERYLGMGLEENGRGAIGLLPRHLPGLAVEK
jgi:hypothetical protein